MAKKKKNKKYRFKKMNFIELVSIIYSSIILYMVISIDILPTKYIAAAIGVFAFINLIFFILINQRKRAVRAFTCLFLVLFCDALIIGSFYLNKTFTFMKENFGDSSESIPTESYNIFVSGHDFDNLRDFNMLITVNMTTHKILLTSIPRDYYIDVAGYDHKDKLSFITAGLNTTPEEGLTITKDSIANLFGTNIDYVVDIQTNSIVTLVDTIGGIEYCSDYEYTTTHAQVLDTYDDSTGRKLRVKKGCQHLNGIQTLTVARERNAFPGRDRQRQKNCQDILISIFKKMASPEILMSYTDVLDAVGGLYETDVPMGAVTNVVKDVLQNGMQWKFDKQSVDGDDVSNAVVLANSRTDWAMIPNQKTVDDAKKNIEKALK